ncbi:MAG: hypothetical protein KIT18_00570 [Burkholderiales bacterium]|nr:hypothetical protein [Burkholderiales bacterium]
MRRRLRGITFLEFVVVLIILGLVSGVLFDRFRHYQEMAERASMDATLRIIKTGLQLRLAELLASNRQNEAQTLEVENPTLWLSRKPTNYAGDYYSPPEPGHWYYDLRRRDLVYVVSTGSRLQVVEIDGCKQLRFKVKVVKNQILINNDTLTGIDGVTLVPVYPYAWP